MEPLEVSLGEVTQFSSLYRCCSTVISVVDGLILEGTCSLLCRFYLHRSNTILSISVMLLSSVCVCYCENKCINSVMNAAN